MFLLWKINFTAPAIRPFTDRHIAFGSAGVVCAAGSMKLPGVRTSVCPIIRPPHTAAAGLLLWAGRQEISIDCCTAGCRRSAAAAPQHDAQQQMRAVRRWQLTQEANHRLAIAIIIIIFLTPVLRELQKKYKNQAGMNLTPPAVIIIIIIIIIITFRLAKQLAIYAWTFTF